MTRKKPYKEPVFLFTSSSMRLAAWAGWYSAFGDKKNAEDYIQMAHTEWVHELGAGRKYDFLDRYNHDMWQYVPKEVMQRLVDGLFKSIKKEIKKGKATHLP